MTIHHLLTPFQSVRKDVHIWLEFFRCKLCQQKFEDGVSGFNGGSSKNHCVRTNERHPRWKKCNPLSYKEYMALGTTSAERKAAYEALPS